MANVQFSDAAVFRRVTVGKVQTAESVRISVKNDITEVYSVGVENVVNSYEARSGEASFYGKTAIKFLYNDGTAIAGSTYGADFTASIASDVITPDSKLCFEVATADTQITTNANTATLTIILEVTAFAYVSSDILYFSDCEDCFVKRSGVEVLTNGGTINLPMVVDEQLSATKNIGSVLLAESALCISDYTNVDGVLRVSGDASVRLTYLSDGVLTCDVLPFKFERELDSAEIPANAQLSITPAVRATKVRLDIAEDSVNTDFSVEISVSLCVEYCVTAALETVVDAYGLNCDFAFSRQNFLTTLPCGSAFGKKTVSGTLPVDGGRKVLAVVNIGAIVTACDSQEKSARVEGVVTATAIYEAENGIVAEPVELPFVEKVDVSYLAPQCQSRAIVSALDFTLTSAGSVQATAALAITIDSFRDVSCAVITAAEEKPFDKSASAAIEVCLASKGDTVWTLAKNLHMSQEDLLSVNTDISDPLENDARIVVYNKI